MDIKDEDKYEKEKFFNDYYYLGNENGLLIVNKENIPFNFKLYNNEKEVEKCKESNLFFKNGKIIFNEKNEIICIAHDNNGNFLLSKNKTGGESIINCDIFKKIFSNDFELIYVKDNSLITFDKKVIFSPLPYNYSKQNIRFCKLQNENQKILTNSEGHPLLASIKNDEIIIFYKKENELLFNEEETINTKQRLEIKLKKKILIKTDFQNFSQNNNEDNLKKEILIKTDLKVNSKTEDFSIKKSLQEYSQNNNLTQKDLSIKTNCCCCCS